MEVIDKKIEELTPYAKNPRKNDQAVNAVTASIREFGFKVPIVIDSAGVIVTGHTRLKAALLLGLETVPCVVADDLTEDQIKAFRLADNKTAELAEWDLALLDEEIAELTDIDMSLFGFDTKLVAAAPEIQEDPEEDTLPESIPSRCKSGDIWEMGGHRLICGDSTDANVLNALIDGAKANMIFTDPPYGMSLNTDFSSMKSKMLSAEKRTKNGTRYDQGKVDEFHPEMIDTIFTIKADEVFLWGADYFAELLPDKNAGSWIVWDKRANGDDDAEADYSSDKMYGSCFELCWSKKKHKRDIARIKWAGIFGVENEFDHRRHHPTQKPVMLAKWFLERYSKEGEIILDIFGGSGSTLLACEQMKRNCRMCEIDEHYCDVILKRWENLTGQTAVLIEHYET